MAGRIAPLKRGPRRGVPLPGVGGYDYPRGPYGATGFPGSTPAAPPTHPQTPDGQRGARQTRGQQITHGIPQDTKSQINAKWAQAIGPDGLPLNPHARNQPLATGTELRMTPVIGNAIGNRQPLDKLRNSIARDVWAVPWESQEYLSAPNPGKNGGSPATYGNRPGYDNDAGAVRGGQPTPVTVPRRYVSLEGSQEGYAMNRNEVFGRVGNGTGTDPGYGAFPKGYNGDYHLRGGRLTGERYYGALYDQQRIGLDSDAYGIARRRGPRHRPTRFEQPGTWTRNYYDVPASQGTEAPDMIHQSAAHPRRPSKPLKRRG